MAWRTIRRILVYSYLVGQQLIRLHVSKLLRLTFLSGSALNTIELARMQAQHVSFHFSIFGVSIFPPQFGSSNRLYLAQGLR